MSIGDRFSGERGRRKLIALLRKSPLVDGNQTLAEQLVQHGIRKDFNEGDYLIRQGDDDDDIYFLISGEVDILVNQRYLTTRKAPDHVGEMSLVNPKEERSADVVARKETTTLVLGENVFSEIADTFSGLWKNIAIELSDRLKQREKRIQGPNPLPRILIIYPHEQRNVAKELQGILEHNDLVVELWSDMNHIPSTGLVESHLAKAQHIDFAILFLKSYPEETFDSDHPSKESAQQVFELGLFMGAVGRKRTFMIMEKASGAFLGLPKNIEGLRIIEYDLKDGTTTFPKVQAELLNVIQRLGPR